MFGFNQNNNEDSSNYIFVQTIDKKILKVFLSDTSEEQTEDHMSIPHLCYKLQTGYIAGQEVVFGLTSNLRLYINDKIFSNECTSFFQSQTFLSFINSTSGLSHELFIYDLNRNLPKPVNQSSNSDPPRLASLEDDSNFNVRAVERGSRIVVINGTKTIL